MKMSKKRGEMNKKAQITIFIVLGILILFTTATYVYVKTRIMKEEVKVPEVLVKKVPLEVQPVKEYIEACIKTTAEKGLITLEDHGGYTNFSEFKLNPIFPTQGNAVEYFPNSNILIPYWHYMKSDDNCRENCEFDSLMLPLTGDDSIETQLENYIKLNLNSCLNDFRAFENQGYKFREKGPIEPTASIREKDIVIKVNYPIDVEKEGKTTLIKDYSTIIPSKLNELYEIANDIIDYERDRCFIEKHILNYLSLYQGLDEGDLPPVAMSTIGTRKEKIWIKPEVENQVQTLTMSGLKLLQTFNTTGMDWPRAPLKGDFYDTLRQSIYNQFIFFPLKKEHDAKIEFSYFNWFKPYFDILPSQGALIRPNTYGDFAGKLGFLGTILQFAITKDYSFSYQYSFPVIIDITVPTDTGVEKLRFAIEANIRNNACFKPKSEYSITARAPASLLCDPDQRTGENITIEVTDKFNRTKKLSDVAVYFYAGDSCYIGNTDENGILKAQLPNAVGWWLNLKKDGYADLFVHQTEFTSNLTMTPLKELNVLFVLINETNYNILKDMSYSERKQKRNDYLTNLTKNHTIVLQLKRIKEKKNDPEIEQVISFMDEKAVPETIKLMPGKYTIDAQLFMSGNFTIPEERDKICEQTKYFWDKCKKETFDPPKSCGKDCLIIAECKGSCKVKEDITYPKLELTMIINGGAYLNESRPWKLDEEKLYNSNKVVFYLYSQNIPTRQKHLEEMEKYKEWSKKKSIIEPRLE